ncbi:MAG: DUF4325 domain-containing protein [Candidatus Buchananbacteria bacterium]
MKDKGQILKFIEAAGRIKSKELAKKFNISRQYATSLLRSWVSSGKLQKIGSTRNSFYVTKKAIQKNPEVITNYFAKKFINKNLEEHRIIAEIENHLPLLARLKKSRENIYSIFHYAFSEMFNNAIEHSQSKYINVIVALDSKRLFFIVNDYGIGVYKNVMKSRKLKSELEAIQDILKGKTTTAPHVHSGEGIFFTSKVADVLILDSFSYQLIFDNIKNDVFLNKLEKIKRGTSVTFSISMDSSRHLNDIFKKYTGTAHGYDSYGFDKTEVKIKLYTIGGIHISRSQARRVLSGLEKFKSVILDFDKVSMIGQAFADEIFRVFKNRHPEIEINAINMVEAVKFMVDRVEKE